MDMNFQYITIIILLITSNTYSFNSGELIDANNLNSKFNSYQLALSKINININFEDLLNNTKINSENLNDNINLLKPLSNELNLINNFNFSSNINALDFNNIFDSIENGLNHLVGNSCNELLSNRPELLNNDGIYYLDIDGLLVGEDPFPAYCDMTTSGGGWTLLLANEVAPLPTSGTYPSNNSLYSGLSTINTDISIFNTSINVQDMQKAIRKVSGQYVRIFNYVNKSTMVSTFKEKLDNRTSWVSNFDSNEVSGLPACSSSLGRTPAWDYSYNGTNTYMYFLAGCHFSESYGDRQGAGISARAEARATSCGAISGRNGTCNYNYLIAFPAHRGISYGLNDSSSMMWIK